MQRVSRVFSQCCALMLGAVLVSPAQAAEPGSFAGVVEVNTVNVDVVVTDGGQPVSTLSKGDFEVWEDGQRRTVTNFARVVDGTVHLPAGTSVADASDLRYRRHLAFVFDLNFTERPWLKRAVAAAKAYVSAQGSDAVEWSVTVVGTSSQILQPFTTDTDRVLSALDAVLTQPTHRLTHDIDTTLITDPLRTSVLSASVPATASASGSLRFDALKNFSARELGQRSLQVYYMFMRSLVDIFRAYATVPGNKACLVVTGDMTMHPKLSQLANDQPQTYPPSTRRGFDPVLASIREDVNTVWGEMIRLANTTGFRVYVANAMGLDNPMTYALAESGSVGSLRPSDSEADWESLPRTLADGTGGAYFNANSINPALTTAGEQMKTYYSLGFDAPHGHDGAYHAIKVKVTRPGLHVSFRDGLYDLDPETVTAETLASPATLPKRGGALPLTVQVDAHRTKAGTEVAATAITPAAGLTFLPQGNREVARIGVLMAVYDGDGQIMDLKRKTQVIDLPTGAAAKVGDQPFTYTMRFDRPAGAATVAMALYDAGSGTTGMAQAPIPVS